MEYTVYEQQSRLSVTALSPKIYSDRTWAWTISLLELHNAGNLFVLYAT